MTTTPWHARIAAWVKAQEEVDSLTTALRYAAERLKLAEARALLAASTEGGPITGKNADIRSAQFLDYLDRAGAEEAEEYRSARLGSDAYRVAIQDATTRRDEAQLLLQVERELLRFRTAELGRPDRDAPVYVFGKTD